MTFTMNNNIKILPLLLDMNWSCNFYLFMKIICLQNHEIWLKMHLTTSFYVFILLVRLSHSITLGENFLLIIFLSIKNLIVFFKLKISIKLKIYFSIQRLLKTWKVGYLWLWGITLINFKKWKTFASLNQSEILYYFVYVNES